MTSMRRRAASAAFSIQLYRSLPLVARRSHLRKSRLRDDGPLERPQELIQAWSV